MRGMNKVTRGRKRDEEIVTKRGYMDAEKKNNAVSKWGMLTAACRQKVIWIRVSDQQCYASDLEYSSSGRRLKALFLVDSTAYSNDLNNTIKTAVLVE